MPQPTIANPLMPMYKNNFILTTRIAFQPPALPRGPEAGFDFCA